MADPPPPRRFTGVRGAAAGVGAASTDAAPPAAAASPSSAALAPAPTPPRRFVRQQVPDSILHDPALAAAASSLPQNYQFELPKTIWRLREWGSTKPALQFPEGLLLFATTLSDIIAAFVPGARPLILGDVAYGACCVDDRAARAAGADALIHYGHSCLIPAPSCVLPILYVFVDIAADADHLVRSVVASFSGGVPGAVGGVKEKEGEKEASPPSPSPSPSPAPRLPHLALAGTIQFGSTVAAAAVGLRAAGFPVTVPQAKPLSPGEVLGCTAPRLGAPPPPRRRAPSASEAEAEPLGPPEAILFVADGRFHMESLMIANPLLPAFRYCPYARALTSEAYDQAGMRKVRAEAVRTARGTLPRRGGGGGEGEGKPRWGLALSTLGRQASSAGLVARLRAALAARGVEVVTVLLSEVTPAKLAALSGGKGESGKRGAVSAWVQVACPRLSIDWGEGFELPTLTPYEALVALGAAPWWEGSGEGEKGGEGGKGCGEGCGGCGGGDAPPPATPALIPYPMDFYSAEGGAWGAWHAVK